ncbi:MAG: hypothetical protein JWO54_750 [Candidatus Saccharibacteria bacterium]|nr:hypothetical protein [Candidatus Saccharibacteria bacterium]MDB5180987.1 hypothetical protein [Candidatus Saccharibacteria bacterium]
MSRLPNVGGDDNEWGVILNDYLSVSLNSDGTLKTASLPASSLTSSGIVELATTAEAITGTDAVRAVTPAGLSAANAYKADLSHTHSGADITSGSISASYLPASSAAASGIVELATVAETLIGTDTVRAVTPAGVDAALVVGSGPITLIDAATVETDASLSNYFRVGITASRTLGAPTNPTDGQRILWEITAVSGNKVITPAIGTSGSFKFGSDFTVIPMILSGTTTFIGAVYRSSTARWHIISVGSGH